MKITKKLSSKNFALANRRILSFLMLFAIFFTMAQFILIQSAPDVDAKSLLDSQTGLQDEIGKEAFGQKTPKNVQSVMAGIIRVFLEFLGIIFLIMMLFGGFKWMTAGGNEENITQAKSYLTKAFIGLLITLSAWTIAQFITTCVADIVSTSMFKNICP